MDAVIFMLKHVASRILEILYTYSMMYHQTIKKTVDGYKDLVLTIIQNNHKDMYIVPIICIEYHIWKMMYKYNYITMPDKIKDIFIDNLIKDFDW